VENLIKELLVFNERLISSHQVNVKTTIETNLPKLKCNIKKLKQILINLITNAVKYSNEGSEVKIIAKSFNQKIQIEISDAGIGMTTDEIQMALNGDGKNIYKSGLNKNIPYDCHGLGMPIVKQLMDLMGGELKIESEKNKGTKVILGFTLSPAK
jgi:signal transduction histidine kinase